MWPLTIFIVSCNGLSILTIFNRFYFPILYDKEFGCQLRTVNWYLTRAINICEIREEPMLTDISSLFLYCEENEIF